MPAADRGHQEGRTAVADGHSKECPQVGEPATADQLSGDDHARGLPAPVENAPALDRVARGDRVVHRQEKRGLLEGWARKQALSR
jgi:hypothetical protein